METFFEILVGVAIGALGWWWAGAFVRMRERARSSAEWKLRMMVEQEVSRAVSQWRVSNAFNYSDPRLANSNVSPFSAAAMQQSRAQGSATTVGRPKPSDPLEPA